MKIKKYIDKIVENGNDDDMEKLSEMLIDSLMYLKEHDYKKFKEYKDELYCLAYGPVLSEDMVEEIIDRIGEHWSQEQTDSVKNQNGYNDIDSLDFYVVMNMAYSDYKEVFGDDVNMYARFSKAFIEDEDAKEGKVYYYFTNIPKEYE